MERLFPCKKPPIGRSHASVLVDEDGLAIVHRLVKGQLEIAADQLVGVVLDPGREDDDVVLSREVRRLDLVTDMYSPANVLVVFGRPVRVAAFGYGAEKVLSINRRERKHGVEVDAIGVTVDDPNGLVAAITQLGVRGELTVTEAYVKLVGQIYGTPAAEMKATKERARRRRRVLLPLFIGLFTALLAAQVSVRDGTNLTHVGAVVLSALGWATVIAVWINVNSGPVSSQTPMGVKRARTIFAMLLAGVALMFVPLAGGVWLHTRLGIPRAISTGLAAGGPGGLFGGWALRLARAG